MKSPSAVILSCVLCPVFGSTVASADSHSDAPEILAQTDHVQVLPGHGLDFEKAYTEPVKMHAEAGSSWVVNIHR
jgi:hypothetical protein